MSITLVLPGGFNLTEIKRLARKLAVLMHRIWADGTEYRWQREAAVEA